MSEKRIYDKNGKVIKIIFTIPVGYMTPEETDNLIKKTLSSFKKSDNVDYFFPTRELKRQELLKNRKQKLNKLFNDN